MSLPARHTDSLEEVKARLSVGPWKVLRLNKLQVEVRFQHGAGWGRNAWGEYYKGPTTRDYYVRIPKSIAEAYHVLVIFNGQRMIIERGTNPAKEQPRSWQSPELWYYYPWNRLMQS